MSDLLVNLQQNQTLLVEVFTDMMSTNRADLDGLVKDVLENGEFMNTTLMTLLKDQAFLTQMMEKMLSEAGEAGYGSGRTHPQSTLGAGQPGCACVRTPLFQSS